MDLIVRADATLSNGAGHAMRCAGLAEAWRELSLGHVRLWGDVSIPFVLKRWQALDALIDNRPPTKGNPAVMVVDTYSEADRRALAGVPGPAVRVLVDDLGEAVPAGFHVVWNPNVYATDSLYSHFDGIVIAGPEAVPIRSGLPAWTGMASRSVGVIVGGGSVDEQFHRVLTNMARRSRSLTFVGAGTWLPAGWAIADSLNPWSMLAECGRVIIGAGSTVWEAARVGVPVVVVQTAVNQALIARWAAGYGAPVIEASTIPNHEELYDALDAALARAVSLPDVVGGAANVARRLHRLAKG